MKNLKNSRRGDIPITILVLGVVLICMTAIFSFYFSSNSVKNSLNSVGIIQKAAVSADKILLYQNLGFSSDQIDKVMNVQPADSTGHKYISFYGEGISVVYYLP